MANYRNIVILTGAGISAESGIQTFRASDGLWEEHRIEDVATPEAYARDPDLVHRFYDARREAVQSKAPNAAHLALAELDAAWPGELLLVTQNVDDLHNRAGSKRLIHMHGELTSAWCTACGDRHHWTGPLSDYPACTSCATPRSLRPDIVWFGEMPYQMEAIDDALARCDLFVSIGTSGNVYPAAGFVQEARRAGAKTLELNMEPSEGSYWFNEARHGPATQLVPQWVHQLLGF